MNRPSIPAALRRVWPFLLALGLIVAVVLRPDHEATEPSQRNPAAARLALERAAGHAARAEFTAAGEAARLALDADPTAHGAYRVLGYARYRAKRFDEAREALEQALLVNPDDAFAACFLGLTLAEHPRGADDEARSGMLLERSLGGYRGAEPWYGLGILAQRAGKLDEAIAGFTAAVRADPGWESARYRLAEANRLAGHPDEARTHAEAFERLKSTRTEFERLARVVAERPADHAARLELARLCLDTGRHREAREQFEALATSLDTAEVREGLRRSREATEVTAATGAMREARP
jgi:tetratricopeptide (TPR) repeat protein